MALDIAERISLTEETLAALKLVEEHGLDKVDLWFIDDLDLDPDTEYIRFLGACPTWTGAYYRARLKPQPKQVLLTRDDIPSGSIFMCEKGGSAWRTLAEIGDGYITLNGKAVMTVTFDNLKLYWLIKRPGSTNWEPCYKEISE